MLNFDAPPLGLAGAAFVTDGVPLTPAPYYRHSPDPTALFDQLRRQFGELSCVERECQGCLRVLEYQGRRQIFHHVCIDTPTEVGQTDRVVRTMANRPLRCAEQGECCPDGLDIGELHRRLPRRAGGDPHLAVYRLDRQARRWLLTSCHSHSPMSDPTNPDIAEAGERGTPGRLPGGGPRS